MIIQVPRGGAIARQLNEHGLPVAEDDVVVEVEAPDAEGNLDAPTGGEVVLSVPSPATLSREPEAVRRAITQAGTGVEPLVVVIGAAEELREDELAAVLEAAAHAARPVIVRIIRDA